jgi:hypothetical protein
MEKISGWAEYDYKGEQHEGQSFVVTGHGSPPLSIVLLSEVSLLRQQWPKNLKMKNSRNNDL